MTYRKRVKRVDPQNSYRKDFFFFSMYPDEMMLGEPIVMIIIQHM